MPHQLTGKKAITDRTEEVILEGKSYPIPPNDCGAPGKLLESLFHIAPGNKDLADTHGVEIKFSSKKSLLTLFHLDPEKDGTTRALVSMVEHYGKRNEKGQLGFYCTVRCNKPKRFKITTRRRYIICSPVSGSGPNCKWYEGAIKDKVAGKLKNVLVVYGKFHYNGSEKFVTFTSYSFLQGIDGDDFIRAIYSGIVAIDFDAREKRPGAGVLRDHSPKFRISLKDLDNLWDNIEHWEPNGEQSGAMPKFETRSETGSQLNLPMVGG